MSAWAATYYRTYNRALLRYVTSGFLARELDADDHAFLERVRERGAVACGSLGDPCSTDITYSDDVIHRRAVDEELGFWRSPWAVERGVERRVGMPEAERLERAARRAHYARQAKLSQAQRQADKATEAAELAAELQAWNAREEAFKKEREERLRRTAIADLEWERAHPSDAKERARVAQRRRTATPRHYIPDWKMQDEAAERLAERAPDLRRTARLLLRAHRTLLKLRAEQAAIAAAVKAEAEADRQRRIAERAERLEQWAAKVEGRAPLTPAAVAQLAAAKARAKARAAAEAEQQLAEYQERLEQSQDFVDSIHTRAESERLKAQIVSCVCGSIKQQWSISLLMRVTQCTDRDFLEQCCTDLVSEGRLRERQQ